MEMRILLSIRPEHASNIWRGRKTIEIRRRWRRAPGPITALVYVTSPRRMIEGVVWLGMVTRGHPDFLWPRIDGRAAITDAEFRAYAGAAKVLSAIEIDHAEPFENPIDPRVVLNRPPMRPPRSWRYIYPAENELLAQAGFPLSGEIRA